MSAASDYLENKLVDHVTGKASFTKPTAYVALCTAAPNDASTGSTITEADYTSYARVETSASDWDAASSGSAANAAAIEFPECTGGSNTVTHFVLVDASSSGNVLVHGALSSSLDISDGITPSFAIGTLTVSCD